MTIQCMIINKSSLILSSDLTVTMDDYKSYYGVKKVFEIEKKHACWYYDKWTSRF